MVLLVPLVIPLSTTYCTAYAQQSPDLTLGKLEKTVNVSELTHLSVSADSWPDSPDSSHQKKDAFLLLPTMTSVWKFAIRHFF